MTAIKLRRGTADQWATINPVLAAGEPGFETDTGKHKIGDGLSAWSSLEYFMNVAMLATRFAPAGTAGVSTGGMVAALQSTNNLIGAALLQATTPYAARDAIDALKQPLGAYKMQVIKTFTTLTGLTRPSDPDNELAVEFRGPTNPSAVMLADDSWVIVG